jgi:hypothetical protein
MDKNKQSVDQLNEYLERIDRMIKQLDKEGLQLGNLFSYADLEREQEVNEKIKEEIRSARDDYASLIEKRDQLSKGIN